MRSFLSLSLLFAFTTLQAAPTLEWPRFRGADGSGVGVAPNLAPLFSEADYNWKIELPGKGHSSPVIAGDKLFITCTPADSAKRMLLAIDPATGKTVWQQSWETAAFRQHADNSYTSASPAVDAERVYIWWTSPEQSWLAGLDQKTGKEIWKKELGGFVSQHGAGSSPIVFEDSVILDFGQEGTGGDGSYTLCVDAKTGKERWKTPRKSESSTASTPLIYTPPGGGAAQLILMSHSAGLTSLDPHTGKTNWDLPNLMPKRCVASPTVTKEGLIIAQCGEGASESFIYAVRPAKDGKSAEKVYEISRTGGYVCTPLAVGDRLFLWKENGLITCLKSATGEQVWSQRIDGPFYGSPVCVNNRLYNITRRGDLVVLAASDKFEQVGRIPLGEGSFATPALAGGHMYLRTFSHLISVGK